MKKILKSIESDSYNGVLNALEELYDEVSVEMEEAAKEFNDDAYREMMYYEERYC